MHEQPDILRGPSHRSYTTKPTTQHPEPRTFHKITACCSLSMTNDSFYSPASAAQWWRERRTETLPCVATDNRRVNTIRKLELAGLEAL